MATKKKSPQRAMTPTELERLLARGFDAVRADLDNAAGAPDIRSRSYTVRARIEAARLKWSAIREAHGFKADPAAHLLSVDIAKTQKNTDATYALALLPHKMSGRVNVCAWEDSCASSCVAFSGKGGTPQVMRSRAARVAFMLEDPRAFAWVLFDELDKLERSGERVAVRLNTYSDIRYERVAPWLFAWCGRVMFYDYTKHPEVSRPADSMPRNYRLTYSVSPRTKLDEVRRNIDAARNVAVVFDARAHSKNDGLPETWCGLEVIDGDETDERYADPVAVVVGLRRKGSLRAGAPLTACAVMLDNAASLEERAR